MLKEKLITYFKSGETEPEQFKVGAEFENIIINKNDLKTAPFHGSNGIESLLAELTERGWQTQEKKTYTVEKDGTALTIEPGGQLKVRIKKTTSIKEIDQIYLNVLKDIFPLLEKRNQYMLTIGYQPTSKVEEIEDSNEAGYKYMAKYMESQGKYALHMLKGTAGTYVTFDYAHQDNFRKKIQVAYTLSPVMTALFDNSPIFEGEEYKDKCLRRLIWNNSDDKRCKITGILNRGFGYEDYAEFLINCPPMFIKDGDELVFTGEKTLGEIYQNKEITEEEIEHAISMVFPEIRVGKSLEIRMADALPYPLNMAYITLWKTLFDSKENLDSIYEFVNTIKEEDIVKANKVIVNMGLDTKLGEGTLRDLAKDLFFMAGSYCLPIEKHYLQPLEALLFNEVTPREVTLRHLKEIKK